MKSDCVLRVDGSRTTKYISRSRVFFVASDAIVNGSICFVYSSALCEWSTHGSTYEVLRSYRRCFSPNTAHGQSCLTVLLTPSQLNAVYDQVEELQETASRTIAAEWNTQTAGGCHIHPEWKKNPCFHLKLRTPGPAKVRHIFFCW